MKTIAYQGVMGAFSHMTALKAYGEDKAFLTAKSFQGVFEMVSTGKADCALVPIENSLIGSIYENYDLLNAHGMRILAEHFTRIEHCLMVVPGGHIDDITAIEKVISHPKALEQCRLFFRHHPWIEAVSYFDTAAAAAEIAAKTDASVAAIASAGAAEIYGLDIFKRGIEDDPQNYTRFILISKNQWCEEQADKCSLMVDLMHTPGTLTMLLKTFADEEINLTKIESRPLRGSPFKYQFYLDFEFPVAKHEKIKNLLKKMEKNVQKLMVLGFYKKEHLWTN